MPRFFINYEPSDIITVTDDDAHHIGKSLRMKIGEEITFCSSEIDYQCIIIDITETEVICKIQKAIPTASEPDVKLTLYQALPKGDKFELIIQKTAELGVSRIVPFISKRCVARPDEKSFAKKLERYRKIAEEAAKQAGRGIVPEVSELMTVSGAIEDMNSSELKLICYENGGEKLIKTGITEAKSISVMIGSEGGFERNEVDLCIKNGAIPIWLGERILRCETCPIAMTAIIMNLTGNM